jgi:hypothetical protein
VIALMATRELAIPGSEVALRFKQDRSAVRRATQRVERDAELLRAAIAIIDQLRGERRRG